MMLVGCRGKRAVPSAARLCHSGAPLLPLWPDWGQPPQGMLDIMITDSQCMEWLLLLLLFDPKVTLGNCLGHGATVTSKQQTY